MSNAPGYQQTEEPTPEFMSHEGIVFIAFDVKGSVVGTRLCTGHPEMQMASMFSDFPGVASVLRLTGTKYVPFKRPA